MRNIPFCNKTPPCLVSPLEMTLLGIKFDVISFYDVICKTERHLSVRVAEHLL